MDDMWNGPTNEYIFEEKIGLVLNYPHPIRRCTITDNTGDMTRTSGHYQLTVQENCVHDSSLLFGRLVNGSLAAAWLDKKGQHSYCSELKWKANKI